MMYRNGWHVYQFVLEVILGMYSSFGVLTNLEVKRTYFDQVYILILRNPEYIEGGAGVM